MKPLLVVFVIVAAACDLATTELALREKRLKELNPLMRNQKWRVALKAAATAVVIGVASMLAPVAGNAMLVVCGCLWVGAAVWNVTQISRY